MIKPIKEIMGQVENLAQLQGRSTATSETSAPISKEHYQPYHQIELPDWVHELYMRFAVIYKNKKWVDETDELELATKLEWSSALMKALSYFGVEYENIIAETIDEVAQKHAWPPSPAEFLEIAIPKARRAKERKEIGERVNESNPLLVKKPSKEVARTMMANLRVQMKEKGIRWGK